jgi:hypothetical protein
MLSLASEGVAVRIDPRHGGEVLDLIDLRSGRQLLGRPPFGSDEPVPGELDETTWTRSYRGGWQLLVPNAGNACVVDGVAHGFHGRASTDAWTVEDHDPGSATLCWRGHDLEVKRQFTLSGDAVTVGSEVIASRDTELVWVEHISLGLELLDPALELELPDCLAYEVSEQTGPTAPPKEAAAWPEVRLLDGTLERADRALLRSPRSRMMIVAGLAEGRISLRNRDRGQGVQISWDLEWLPHAWIWHEIRTTRDMWRGMAEMLAVEPASIPHTLGLETARRAHQAHRLAAGERRHTEITLRPLREARC